jgi:uncharacterized protein
VYTFVYHLKRSCDAWNSNSSGTNEKATVNLAKHRVSFLTAAEIFANEILERIDDRQDYGEVRFIALGSVETEVYRVVFTWRGENLIRIISAQKASRDEREIYHRATLP